MQEEIEDRRYFLEPDEGKITSICVVRNDKGAYPTEPLAEFSVVIGIIETAGEAAEKALTLQELLKPAEGIRHGAPLKDGRAVITLSYPCTSPFKGDLSLVSKIPSPAYVLGVLAGGGYLSMDDYEKAMGHYLEMEDIPQGLPLNKTALHIVSTTH